MILPILWVVCGIWFFNSAKKVNAKPWPWVGIMMAASLVIFAVLALAFGAIEESLGVSTNNGNWPVALPAMIGDICLIWVLHSIMMKRVPFRIVPPSAVDTSKELP